MSDYGKRGIDSRHPMIVDFAGDVSDLSSWTRGSAKALDAYRQGCQPDPGPSMYVYTMVNVGDDDGIGEVVYVGITGNPHLRFSEHRKKYWWRRVNWVLVERIDCLWHDEVCSFHQLQRAARHLENWLIDLHEPTENRASLVVAR